MSDSPNHSTARPLPPGIEMQDNEDISWGGLGLLALMALIIFALGTAFSLFILQNGQGGRMTQQDNPTAPILVGCKEDQNRCASVGIVEQRQIPIETRARDAKRKSIERLSTYGWLDETKKSAHIPVEEGMKKIAAGERP